MSKMAKMATCAATSLSTVAEPGGIILLALLGVGVLLIWFVMPFSVALTGLFLLLTFVHQQIRLAYPGGGAALLVREQWGESAGQVVSATLWLDALLAVAVGIAGGFAQIASLFPVLFAYKIPIVCALLLLFTYANLRGIQAPSSLRTVPTYFFVTTLLLLLGSGLGQVFNGTLDSLDATPSTASTGSLSAGFIFGFLVLRTLSAGSSVLPGLGPERTRHPGAKGQCNPTSATTFGWDIILLLLLYLGISALGEWVRVQSTATETMLAQVVRIVYYDPLLQFLTLGALALVLLRVAYTGLVKFPHLATLQAGAGCLPKRLHESAHCSSFRWGLILLTVMAACLLFIFHGDVEHLLPLYTFNAFFHLALAQSALVIRWRRIGLLMQTGVLTPTHPVATLGSLLRYDPHWRFKWLFQGFAACLTGTVVIGLFITQFTTGVWLILLLLSSVTWGLRRLQQHYQNVVGCFGNAAERSATGE